MEIKCALCGKWILFQRRKFNRMLTTIMGEKQYKDCWNIFCSDGCSIKCNKIRADITRKWKLKHKQHNYIINCTIQDLIKQRKKENKHKIVVERKLLSSIRVFQRRIGGIYYRTTEMYKNRKRKKGIDKIEQFKKDNPKEYKLIRLYYYAGVRAKQKNMERTITLEWLKKECENNICSVTGKTFDYNSNYHRNPYGPSVDRIDITKGYTPENCRIVIWAFNRARDHYTDKDVYSMCKTLLVHNSIA